MARKRSVAGVSLRRLRPNALATRWCCTHVQCCMRPLQLRCRAMPCRHADHRLACCGALWSSMGGVVPCLALASTNSCGSSQLIILTNQTCILFLLLTCTAILEQFLVAPSAPSGRSCTSTGARPLRPSSWRRLTWCRLTMSLSPTSCLLQQQEEKKKKARCHPQFHTTLH